MNFTANVRSGRREETNYVTLYPPNIKLAIKK